MSGLYKQLRPGLYYVEYDDFNFDEAAEMTGEKYRPRGPMCSGVRKGDCIGRNLDAYADFDTVLVMKVGNRCARYSSISITTDYVLPVLSIVLDRQVKDDNYKILPQLAFDGINEKGVSIASFLVPNGNATEDRSKWGGREWGRSAAFTNPDAAKTYNTMLLTRLVLDNASDVDEAIELIKDVNWFDPDKFTSSGNAGSLKWLLSDPRKSAVIECIDNRMEIQVTEDIDRPSPCTLTTNFSTYLLSKGMIQDDASGYERYDRMAEVYDRDVRDILDSVNMREKYSRDVTDEHFFATDYLWDNSPSGTHFTSTELYRGDAKHSPDFLETVELEKSRYFDKYPRPVSVTTYTSVYNMKEKSASLLYREDAAEGKWYKFKI